MRLRADQNAPRPAPRPAPVPALSWQDIAALALEQDFRLVAPDLGPADAALRGLFVRRRLRSGLVVHMSDAVDLHDLTTRIVSSPGITATVFLRGRASIRLGGRRHEIGAGRDACGRAVPQAVLYSLAEPDVFERNGIRGEHLRKVGLRIPEAWLDEAGVGGAAARLVDRLEHGHAMVLAGRVTQDLARLASTMLAEARDDMPCAGLMLESRALELLARVLDTAADAPSGGVRPEHADARLRAAQEYLAAHLDQDITLAEVARHACVSVSTLQRLFQDRLGMPVWAYLRRLRIEQARAFLERGEGTVTEAALRAGYGSPANFATAFKRHFGISPSQCMR